MKMRLALTLLLTLLCLTFSGPPAMAATIYNTGLPVLDGTGAILNSSMFVVDAEWFCPFLGGCDVTGVSYYNSKSSGAMPVPQTITWLASGPIPFNFKGGTGGTATTISQPPLLSCQGPPVPNPSVCQAFFSTGTSVLQPFGENWINLYNETDAAAGNTLWSFAASGVVKSNTLILNTATGQISGAPNLAFNISGTGIGAQVPEPSSILMLASGILGLAGVLRRKLMR